MSLTKAVNLTPRLARSIIFTVIAITVIHVVYMNIMGISPLNHQSCFVFTAVPRWVFLLYENILELFIMVIIGVLVGVVAEQYFQKIKRFYPRNQMLAFIYASILPICSCGVIPLIDSMKQRTSLKVIITFICAAPLLNPYIVFVSFTVLGLKYAVLRIVSSFLLAVLAGIVVEFIVNRLKISNWGDYGICNSSCSFVAEKDPFLKTMKITIKLLPYILVAGVLSFAFAVVNLKEILHGLNLGAEPWTTLIMTAIGIPLYVCNGVDVVFLKPFLQYTDLTMGSAMAFSLSSSVICISSITMLIKYLGKKTTAILTGVLFVMIVAFSMIINMVA